MFALPQERKFLVPAIGAQHRNRRGVKAQDDGQSGYEQLEAGICVLVGLAGLHLMDQNYRKRKKSDEEEDELFSGDRVREPRFRINGSPKDASPSPKNSESRMSQCVETASVEAAGCLQSPPCGALCAVADGLQDDLPTMLAPVRSRSASQPQTVVALHDCGNNVARRLPGACRLFLQEDSSAPAHGGQNRCRLG